MRYYSVDRRGVYTEGKRIALEPNAEPNGNEIAAHINQMYPNGFSRHGSQFFRDPWLNPTPKDYQSGIIELLLETTRKASYPDKPCRYQSMFACDTIEAAREFKNQKGKPEDQIYELEPQGRVHRGDMSIYAFGSTFAAVDHRLHLYWQGKTLDLPGYQPKWEFLLALPVVVAKKVF